ncbi:hypothetical protein BJV74DRAFT_855699 [Russula compacta]|nr:hypothetical protein BJV74DRAFT_855699 [Russula compacta]
MQNTTSTAQDFGFPFAFTLPYPWRVKFAAAPRPAPTADTAAEPMENMLEPKFAAAAAVTPEIPAPAAVTAAGTPPPMAMLWAVANRLPVITFPMPACMPAATVPKIEVPISLNFGDRVRIFVLTAGSTRIWVGETYLRWDRQRQNQPSPDLQGLRWAPGRH